MAGFILGDFAGGIGQGIEQGEDIRKKYQDRIAAQRVLAANKAAAQIMTDKAQAANQAVAKAPNAPVAPAGPQGVPSPMAGGGPQPGAAPPPQAAQPRPVPVPGATPMPQPPQAGPAPAAPVQAPKPMPAPQGGGGPAPASPAPQGQGGGASTPTDGPFAGLDINQVGQQWQQIKQVGDQYVAGVAKEVYANLSKGGKKVDPLLLMDTVHQMVSDEENLDPTLKQIMLSEVQTNKLQMQFALGQGNLAEKTNKDAQTHDDRQAALAQRAQSADWQHMDRQERNSLYGDFVTLSHEDRQAAIAGANQRNDNNNATKLQALSDAIDDRDWQTVAKITAQEDVAATGAGSREYGAQVGASTDGGKGVAVPKPVRSPLPSRNRNAAAPTNTNTPPASALKEGVHTKFANGQTWTLQNGKPVQVGGGG